VRPSNSSYGEASADGRSDQDISPAMRDLVAVGFNS